MNDLSILFFFTATGVLVVLVVVLFWLLARSDTHWYRRLVGEREAAERARSQDRRDLVFQLLARKPIDAAAAIEIANKGTGAEGVQDGRVPVERGVASLLDLAQFVGSELPQEYRHLVPGKPEIVSEEED